MRSNDSEVRFLNVPLSLSNENQIFFSSRAEQENYFLSKEVEGLSIENSTYQSSEEGAFIRIDTNMEELYKVNYVAFRNNSFTSNYTYAYVKNLKYMGDSCTYVYIEVDYFQTFLFDLSFHNSFIERQTPVTDFYNTLSDTPAHGQLVDTINLDVNFGGGYFVFCSCDITQDNTIESAAHSFSVGNYSIPCWVLYWSETEHAEMSRVLQNISNRGWGDRILSAVYVPFLGDLNIINVTDYTSSIGTIHIVDSMTPTTLSKTVTFRMGSYEKLFKKELTYPYSCIKVMDKCTGQSIELSPDKFYGDDTISFEIQGSISESPYYRVIPLYYEGQEKAYNHSLVVRCNTSLTISNNLYAKYMMQNGTINDMSKIFAGIGGVIGVAGSVSSGNALGAVGSAVSSFENIAMITARENQASKLGNQVNSIQDGAMERICFQNGIKISLYTTDSTHKNMIRNFWKMYGYPVNCISNINLPSQTGGYSYVKTVNANITANIPQNFLSKIISMFDSGISMWSNPNNFLNY